MAGVLPEGHLTAVADGGNRSFVEAGREAGYSMAGTPRDMLAAVRARALKIGHFVELHIEQGGQFFPQSRNYLRETQKFSPEDSEFLYLCRKH